MDSFKQFSAEIQKIAGLHSKSRLARFVCRAEYAWRKYWKNEPMPFEWVNKKEGRAVGDPIDIHHLRLPDMMEHEARGQLTAKVLLEGVCTNAFSVIHSQGIDMQRQTTIQPCWI